MRQVSTGFIEASLSPVGYANAYITINGVTVEASDITDITIQENIGESGAFSIGSFNTSEITITALTDALPNQITGVPISAYFGYYVNGSFEYVPMGTFYAQPKDITHRNLFTTIKGYDRSITLTNTYTSSLNWNTTHTVAQVLAEIQTAMSLTLGSFGGLAPASVTVYEEPHGTYRDVIRQMAILMGTNAKLNRTGALDFIKAFPSTPVQTYGAYDYTSGNFQLTSDAPVSFGKLTINYKHTVDDQEVTTTYEYTAGSGSNTVTVETVNVRTQAQTNTLGQTILGSSGLSFYGYSAALPGQPQIDLGDTIEIEDVFGNEYDLIVLSASHTFNGALKSTLSAVVNEQSPSLNGSNVGTTLTEQVSTINDAASYAIGRAEYASTKADEASLSAQRAEQSASSAQSSASAAQTSAQEANRQAGIATTNANEAIRQAGIASDNATSAISSANIALSSANSATISANNALIQLSTVESVVDTLNWVSSHSTFVATTDSAVQPGKIYYIPSNQTLSFTDGITELNGLTFEVSGGEVTVNGTATAYTAFELGVPNVEAGTKIYLSGVTGGSSSTYGLRYYFAGSGVFLYDGYTTATASANAPYYVVIANGYTAENVKLYPKISVSNDNYDYEIVSSPSGNPSTNGYYELNTDDAVKSYVQSHLALTNDGLYVLKDDSGWKVLIASDGVYIQNPSGATVATYSSNIMIGLATATHTNITAEGMQIYALNGTTQIAHLGYGEANDEDGVSDMPYYTFGSRYNGRLNYYSSAYTYDPGDYCKYNDEAYVCIYKIDIPEAWNPDHWEKAIGGFSLAQGQLVFASGYCSVAEGINTVACGSQSHAEGLYTVAASSSHAEGSYSMARASCSHAQNLFTIADYPNQTVMGKYNSNESTSAFEIGNGTSNSARSNALTVDWDGIVQASGVIAYGVCDTAGATAAKTVTVSHSGFKLVTGSQVLVKFTNANTVASPTLNVNSTGAKAIRRYGTTAPSTSAASSWNAGSVILLIYDGTAWQMVGFLNTTYSSMTDAEYQAGTSTSSRLITPARLKSAILYHATPSNIGAVPTTRTVNGKALSSDISLSSSDVGIVTGTYVYNGASTTSFSFTNSAVNGKSFIICGAQDAGNTPTRATLSGSTITVYVATAITVMRVNYICF